MICRTPDEAFQTGFNSPCEHGIHPVTECDDCRLTHAEISRLAVLLRAPGQALADQPHAA